jgi:hypothetical protein
MNKVSGNQSDFAYIREDGSRIIISYGLTKIDDNLYEWYEVYLYKKQVNQLTLQMVKKAIIADINARTDEKILSGYEWTILHGDDAGKTVKVWLSAENKENYKAKYDTAKDDPELITWPSKFKVSENDDLTPVYEYFANVAELKAFYYGGLNYIEQTVNAGWAEKDAIDWTPYESLFPAVAAQEQSGVSSE